MGGFVGSRGGGSPRLMSQGGMVGFGDSRLASGRWSSQAQTLMVQSVTTTAAPTPEADDSEDSDDDMGFALFDDDDAVVPVSLPCETMY